MERPAAPSDPSPDTTFPVFRIRGGCAEGSAGVIGTVSRTTQCNENWVGDGWLGYLMAGPCLFPGRWHRRGEFWEFAPARREDLTALASRADWTILDGYWGERAEIVLQEGRSWRRARFEPTDAVRMRAPRGVLLRPLDPDESSGAEVVHGGWDHEHCAICWETIGRGGHAEGYLAEPPAWVCEPCYLRFVQPRSLDFIPREPPA